MNKQYTFSGTLKIDDKTYVERPADKLLYEKLKQRKYCYVFNARQTGKSSLRVRVMDKLQSEDWHCALIDLSLTQTKGSSLEQWYAGIIRSLINEFKLDLNVKTWWKENNFLSSIARFREFIESELLKKILGNIVIFIDEIDSILSLDFPTDDFFAFIRGCYNLRSDNSDYNRLTFCILGVATPSDLIKDEKRTPFNIGEAIELTGLDFNNAKEKLTVGLAQKVDDPEKVLKNILLWTGGQPFLTQKLCYLVVTESESRTPNIRELVKNKILTNWEFQDNPEHLRTIKRRVLQDKNKAKPLHQMVGD